MLGLQQIKRTADRIKKGANSVIVSATTGTTVTGAFNHVPPQARVYHSATQSTTSGGATTLDFNSERYDTDNMHSATPSTNCLAIRTAGLYRFTAHVEFAANATGRRAVWFLLNGTTTIGAQYIQATATNEAALCITTDWQCAVNDLIQVQVQQISGGNLNVSASTGSQCELMAVRLGAAG